MDREGCHGQCLKPRRRPIASAVLQVVMKGELRMLLTTVDGTQMPKSLSSTKGLLLALK